MQDFYKTFFSQILLQISNRMYVGVYVYIYIYTHTHTRDELKINLYFLRKCEQISKITNYSYCIQEHKKL